jgi:hypothetical protein
MKYLLAFLRLVHFKLQLLATLALCLLSCSVSACQEISTQVDDFASSSPTDISIDIISPAEGSRIWIEPHGLEKVSFQLQVTLRGETLGHAELPARPMEVLVYMREQKILTEPLHYSDSGEAFLLNCVVSLPSEWGNVLAIKRGSGEPVQMRVLILDSMDVVAESAPLDLLFTSSHFQDSRGGVMTEGEKLFVYLLLTRTEIEEEEIVLNFRTPRSDLIQLVWGQIEPTSPETVWFQNSTVNQARNRLLLEVKNRGVHYTYLIFVDDDAQLSIHSHTDGGGEWGHAWEAYEDMLLEWTPAVAFAEYFIHNPSTYRPEQAVKCVRFTDPLVVAYHFEVAAFVLPYTEHFDDESWNYSFFVASILQSVYFEGHVLQFNRLKVSDDPLQMGYTQRALKWERPFVWLTSAMGRAEQVLLMDARNMARVTVDAQPKKRSGPYIVPAGEFDACHPVFAHLSTPQTLAGCAESRWSHNSKLALMLVDAVSGLDERVKRLEEILT